MPGLHPETFVAAERDAVFGNWARPHPAQPMRGALAFPIRSPTRGALKATSAAIGRQPFQRDASVLHAPILRGDAHPKLRAGAEAKSLRPAQLPRLKT